MPSVVSAPLTVTLNHLSDLPLYKDVKPYEIMLPNIPPEMPQSNMKFTAQRVSLLDMRESKMEFSLDSTGFAPIYHESKCLPAFDDLDESEERAAEVAAPFIEETRLLAEREFTAMKVVVIDWKYRQHQPEKNKNIAFVYADYVEQKDYPKSSADESLTPKTISRFKGPSSHQIAHSDFTFDSGMESVKKFFTPSEVAKFSGPDFRIRIMNIWRPLISEIASAPLAYCDRRTTKGSDFMAYDRVMPDRVAENGFIMHRDEHQWYWLSAQTPKEPMAFVVWDSDDFGRDNSLMAPGLVAHGAFENPNAVGAPPRRSIEVQMIVVTKREE